MDQQLIWWNFISGATRYFHDIVAAAESGKVLLIEEAPYMDHFFLLLQDRIRQWDSSLQIENLHAKNWGDNVAIGETLMNRYAPQSDYHPMDGSRIEYIAKHHLLADRAFIVRNANMRREWIDTAIEYAKFSTMHNGLFILTYSGVAPLTQPRKGVTMLRWGDYFTSYDMQLFASYCVAQRQLLSSGVREYIALLASRIAGTNPNLCSALATEEAALDLRGLLLRLVPAHEEAARLVSERGILEQIIWEAQIQTIFPIIEKVRRDFIERYGTALEDIFPVIDDFDKVLQSPYDMEFRHMWYYYFKSSGFRHEGDESTFRLVYDARNDLAHLEPLESSRIMKIFALNGRG
ncbi:hypothetical protein [Paenibacillus paridis]|uniref:hypothetical protein n=1 Tax=Paenibacillus paridis TaxID=2583376 RepID=UPI001121D8E8|nr:hypothetical protein [Paenibacillus paridis]